MERVEPTVIKFIVGVLCVIVHRKDLLERRWCNFMEHAREKIFERFSTFKKYLKAFEGSKLGKLSNIQSFSSFKASKLLTLEVSSKP